MISRREIGPVYAARNKVLGKCEKEERRSRPRQFAMRGEFGRRKAEYARAYHFVASNVGRRCRVDKTRAELPRVRINNDCENETVSCG